MKFLNFIKSKFLSFLYSIITFIAEHKITSAIILAVVAAITATAIIVSSVLSVPSSVLSSGGNKINPVISEVVSSYTEDVVSEIQPPISSEEVTTSVEEIPAESKVETVAPPPVVNTQPSYNSNMSYDNNVFLDALKYTGYKTDPRMWGARGNYILCSQKKGLGWLSEITYDDYGTASGYEVNAQGLPDIHYFTYRSNGTKRGLVCASYVAYVYFNYLPNVAGIDTSMLARPEKSYSANDWYIAAKKWVDAGYSRYIGFSADDGGSINRDINFNPDEEIPIGSIMVMCDWYNRSQWGSHVSIYAGKVNGYHWVTHVGNENGPELCAIERMNRKPHPQWPIAIITTPSNIRFSAAVEVTVKDENGNPMKDVEINVKRKSNGVVTNLGKTDSNGKVSGEGFSYGEYEIVQTVPTGYTCPHSVQTVNFTTKNNSLNTVLFTNKKVVEKPQSTPTDKTDSENLSN